MLAVSAPPGSETYSGPEACHAARISYRQLDYWARTNLVRPSHAKARGSGTQRRYTYGDVIALAIISELLDAGLSLQSVRPVADQFRHLTADDLDGRYLVLTGHRRARLATGLEFADVLAETGSGVLHLLPLAHVADSVDARLDDFESRRRERYVRTHL